MITYRTTTPRRSKKGNVFGYVQRDIEVPQKLSAIFFWIPSNNQEYKNTWVSKNDIGDLMKTYAEEEGIMSQPRKMLISSFTLQNGTLITPLLLFYLQLGLVVTKIHHFLSKPQRNVSTALHRQQWTQEGEGKETKIPNQVLANSSYGYQIMDRSWHTVTKYLSDKKTHAANNSKLFKRLDHMNNSLYEAELAKAQIEHKEPILVEFFILQYAKLRMLELYYNFFTRFCDMSKYEELEMDTDSLYLALAEKELEDCERPQMRAEWQRLQSNECVDSFTADAVANFFPQNMLCKYKQHDKRGPGLFEEEFRRTEVLCLCSKTYCCYDVTSNKPKFSSKGLNKRVL